MCATIRYFYQLKIKFESRLDVKSFFGVKIIAVVKNSGSQHLQVADPADPLKWY